MSKPEGRDRSAYEAWRVQHNTLVMDMTDVRDRISIGDTIHIKGRVWRVIKKFKDFVVVETTFSCRLWALGNDRYRECFLWKDLVSLLAEEGTG